MFPVCYLDQQWVMQYFALGLKKKGVKDDHYWTLSNVDIMEEMK